MQIRDKTGLEYSVVPIFLCSLPESRPPEVGESGFPEPWVFSQGSCASEKPGAPRKLLL